MCKTLVVVGNGKFANAIHDQTVSISRGEIQPLPFVNILQHFSVHLDAVATAQAANIAAVIHVGSGRQLPEAIDFCSRTGIPLIQASTGMEYEIPEEAKMLCIEAPNLALPILKFIHGLHEMGYSPKRGYKCSLTESHQQSKTSLPGTAVAMAAALGLDKSNIVSIRDPSVQQETLGVPSQHLAGHAIHQVTVEGHGVRISLEVRVYGRDAYIHGILALLDLFEKNKEVPLLDSGKTSIFDILYTF